MFNVRVQQLMAYNRTSYITKTHKILILNRPFANTLLANITENIKRFVFLPYKQIYTLIPIQEPQSQKTFYIVLTFAIIALLISLYFTCKQHKTQIVKNGAEYVYKSETAFGPDMHRNMKERFDLVAMLNVLNAQALVEEAVNREVRIEQPKLPLVVNFAIRDIAEADIITANMIPELNINNSSSESSLDEPMMGLTFNNRTIPMANVGQPRKGPNPNHHGMKKAPIWRP